MNNIIDNKLKYLKKLKIKNSFKKNINNLIQNNKEIQYRYQFTQKLKFSRHLTKNKIDKKKIYIFNCHDGQRKLLFSEIEFYSLLQQKYDLNTLLVVYVGSADGTHEPIIFNLFPELDFYFVDPNPFHLKHKYYYEKNYNKLIIKEFYNNNSYLDIIKIAKDRNKKIVFISDIRTEFNGSKRNNNIIEEDVINNMKQQEKWCIQLNPIAFMLKFRLPWKYNKKMFSYLDGKIYTQIYTLKSSTETRLINLDFRNKIKKYNIQDYENKCYYFNNIFRKNTFTYQKSNLLEKYIAGFDKSFACVTMYYIIDKYLKIYKNKNNEFIKSIVNSKLKNMKKLFFY